MLFDGLGFVVVLGFYKKVDLTDPTTSGSCNCGEGPTAHIHWGWGLQILCSVPP